MHLPSVKLILRTEMRTFIPVSMTRTCRGHSVISTPKCPPKYPCSAIYSVSEHAAIEKCQHAVSPFLEQGLRICKYQKNQQLITVIDVIFTLNISVQELQQYKAVGVHFFPWKKGEYRVCMCNAMVSVREPS